MRSAEELASGDAASLWPRGVKGSREAGDGTDGRALSKGPTTLAESDALRTGESERGKFSVEAVNVGSSRGRILGGGEGLSCARDILVTKAEAGSKSISS
jgi:hypothetical protein